MSGSGAVDLRPATADDDDALWDMLRPAFRAGDSYAIRPDIDRADALAYWTGADHGVWLAEAGGQPLGSYYLKTNQQGGGAHVCNCGFVTGPAARGRGIARAMLDHALDTARAAGFRAMQFNFVVETNTRAIDIWTRAGFQTVGRLPRAFQHPQNGLVDALVLYRWL
ncbi:GNAT family N-acetyltransferase [Sedimentitalea sp. HM32M-2]|uniref:GNAT family N-acetyltransferase n=1 Tax=Sedimentitalea sp. HM32M-2 TaxID=3351566 RepID=UPI00363DEA76